MVYLLLYLFMIVGFIQEDVRIILVLVVQNG